MLASALAPVVAAGLRGAAHAGPEGGRGSGSSGGGQVFQLATEERGPREADLVHGGGDVRSVGPVPEETALFDGHGCDCG